MSAMLANQIAAGEVVERPASVVKELLENALDAGANKLSVDIERAGTALIRVTDNGHGIHADDLGLALQRHATAKLLDPADLLTIRSLGFRGEALPSISSVSDMQIVSRIADADHGRRAQSLPDGSVDIQPASHPVGTTVEVRALFHRLPARKKYLRSERTEFLHIQETVRRLALCRFDYNLELRHNGRSVFNCRGGLDDKDRRIAAVMGKVFTDQAIRLEQEADGMRLWGWLGLEQLSRSSSDRQYLYLNGRVIYDRRLNHAIRVACEDLLAPGRYPAYVLYLEMDNEAADVNVHPAKHEVRFRRARDVHDFVYAAVRETLNRETVALLEPGGGQQAAAPAMVRDSARLDGWSRPVSDRGRMTSPLIGVRAAEANAPVSAWGEILAQVNEEFLLTRRDNGLVLLHLGEIRRHIARQQLENSQQKPVARPLLVPVNLPVDEDVENRLRQIADLLESYALKIELNGSGVCRVRAIPHLLERADIDKLIADLARVDINTRDEAGIRQQLTGIMLEHINDISDKSPGLQEHAALLAQLEKYVNDSSIKKQAPLWSSLDEADLLKLLKDAN